jgi:ankyrin repeat protein
MSGPELPGLVDSASGNSTHNDNDSIQSAEDGISFGPVVGTANSVEVATPVRSMEARTLPSSSSSLQRTSTLLTDNERVVESWIQQSLTMPSATMDGETVQGVSVFADNIIEARMPSTCHRREGSTGSGFSAEGGFSGLCGASPLALASSVSSPSPGYNNLKNESVSHPLFNSEFHASWSNHSTSNSEDLIGGLSSSAILSSAGLISPEGPLTLSRVSSISPSREDENSGISSVIHDAARITNWQTVVDLCQTHPDAAAYVGRDGWTALHHACNRRCPYPNVVKALIEAYPEALLVEEEKGWLPLHYACRFKAPKEVVRLLLQMNPEMGRIGVSRLDRKGRSPLYYAVRYDAPAGVVGLLLEVDASAVLEEDQNADSPLALVWDAWAEKLDGKRTLQKILGSTCQKMSNGFEESNIQHNNSSNRMNGNPATVSSSAVSEHDLMEEAQNVRKRLEGQAKVFERWNKVNVFLKAAFGFTVDEDWELVDHGNEEKKDSSLSLSPSPSERKWRILHALSAIKCHYSLFLLAAALHPEQAFQVDKGDLKRVDNVNKSKYCENPSNMTALHFAAASHASGDAGENVLNYLLGLNPAAAKSVDSEGCTPLHRIAENKYKSDWLDDGVEKLYSAYPGAVRAVDNNGQLPLHRAACVITYQDSLDDDVTMTRSTIVRLLQENEDAANHQDDFGCLPLHLVAKYGRSWDVQVQALYDSNTAAVRARTGVKYSNRLPLHLVAANPDSDFSLVSKLVELNPRGASQADRKGMLPLHLACESGKSWQVVQSIYEASPEAVEQPEDGRRGWMALHMAASAENADNELIANVAQLHPIAATLADASGCFPLHLACMSGKSWENGLSTLFDANPEAIRCPDKQGLLPVHIVALKCCAEAPAAREPTVNDTRTLRLTRAASLEIDQSSVKEIEAARLVGDLFNLLKADPTVLSK